MFGRNVRKGINVDGMTMLKITVTFLLRVFIRLTFLFGSAEFHPNKVDLHSIERILQTNYDKIIRTANTS